MGIQNIYGHTKWGYFSTQTICVEKYPHFCTPTNNLHACKFFLYAHKKVNIFDTQRYTFMGIHVLL